MFSLSSLPYDVIRYIITFIPIQSLAWSRALSLQSIKDNGGLETVFFNTDSSYVKLSFDFLKSLVGERTQSLILRNITKDIFDKLYFLNTPNLKTLQIYSVDMRKVSSLEPLRGMRPESLPLDSFPNVLSLEPLREMRPKVLNLWCFSKVSSLEPLRDMRPESLELRYFPLIESLEPLRNMRPERLCLWDFSKVSSLEPLREMRPKNLKLTYFPLVESIEPLRGLCPSRGLCPRNESRTSSESKVPEDSARVKSKREMYPKIIKLSIFPKVKSLEPFLELCSRNESRAPESRQEIQLDFSDFPLVGDSLKLFKKVFISY